MYPDTHERINTLKKVLTNDEITVETKKIYLVAFVKTDSLNKLKDYEDDEEKIKQFREEAKDLPDDIRFSLLEWSSKKWSDLKVSQVRDIIDKVTDKIN